MAERMSGMVRHRLSPRLPSLRSKVRRGHPVTEIVREAETGDYDLVVVGAGGKDGDHDGSEETAALIARHCPLPVLIVKGDRPALRRILLCTAGGEPGKLDVLFGTRIARRSGAESTLLYVDTSAHTEAQHAAAGRGTAVAGAPRPRAVIERHLEAGVQTLLNQGVHAELKVRQGAVPDEILAEAAEGDYDLIVVGGHLPRSSLRFLDHDLATEILTRADRPVLVVRGTFNQ